MVSLVKGYVAPRYIHSARHLSIENLEAAGSIPWHLSKLGQSKKKIQGTSDRKRLLIPQYSQASGQMTVKNFITIKNCCELCVHTVFFYMEIFLIFFKWQ